MVHQGVLHFIVPCRAPTVPDSLAGQIVLRKVRAGERYYLNGARSAGGSSCSRGRSGWCYSSTPHARSTGTTGSGSADSEDIAIRSVTSARAFVLTGNRGRISTFRSSPSPRLDEPWVTS